MPYVWNRSFGVAGDQEQKTTFSVEENNLSPCDVHRLVVLKADSLEVAAHEKYLQQIKKQGKCLWLEKSDLK